MEFDTKTPAYLTSEKDTFAYVSAVERWPVILTGAIDDLHRTVGEANGEEKIKEGKSILDGLAKLKYELQHDRPLTPLPNDGGSDIEGYNKEIEARGNPTWINANWLFAECYLYRRVNVLFTMSKLWRDYDVFSRQKMSTFVSSRPAVLELAAKYKELSEELEKGKPAAEKTPEQLEEAEKLLFMEMCEICLWGNATDLSLLTSLSYEDIQKLQGAEARKESEKNIVVNQLPAAFEVLNEARKNNKDGNRRVDIVLDNAGFELFVDLILAGYLLSSGLATQIVLNPKSIPWFVSDVIPVDFLNLLSALAEPETFYTSGESNSSQSQPLSEKEVGDLHFLFKQWRNFHEDGKLIMRPHRFWTTGGGYWRLPGLQPTLFEDLRKSELVLFKGDLNYRKLTGDAHWDTTTPFSTAIGPLGTESGMRTLAFRTCKADVVVDLPEGADERLRQTPGGGGDSGMRKWTWTGKWAVVSFCDGKAPAKSNA